VVTSMDRLYLRFELQWKNSVFISPLIFPLVISLDPSVSTFCFATEGIFFELVFLNLPQVGTEKSCVLKVLLHVLHRFYFFTLDGGSVPVACF
jgi:hypothetical protein